MIRTSVEHFLEHLAAHALEELTWQPQRLEYARLTTAVVADEQRELLQREVGVAMALEVLESKPRDHRAGRAEMVREVCTGGISPSGQSSADGGGFLALTLRVSASR